MIKVSSPSRPMTMYRVWGPTRGRRFWQTAIASSALLLGLGACGGGSGGAKPTANSGSLTTIHVATLQGLNALPILVAESEGYLKANGLQVKIDYAPGVALLPAAVNKGQYDFALATQGVLFDAVKSGLDLVVTAGGEVDSAEKPTLSLMVNKDSPYSELADLKGKTVGAPSVTGTTPICLLTWFDHLGEQYTLNNLPLKLVQVPFPNMKDQLAAHRIDAASAVTPFWEGMEAAGMKNLGDPCLYVLPEGVTYTGAFMISKRDWANSHRDVVAGFEKSLDAANKFIQSNPDDAKQILSKGTGLSMDVLQPLTLPEFSTTESTTALAAWLAVLKKYGEFDGDIDVSNLTVEPLAPAS